MTGRAVVNLGQGRPARNRLLRPLMDKSGLRVNPVFRVPWQHEAMDASNLKIFGRQFDLSARGRTRVVLVTVLGTLACLAITLLVDCQNWPGLDAAQRTQSMRTDIALPLLLATPAFAFLMTKLRELAIAHYNLQIVASTDSLTSCLNRGAFMMLVDAYLSRVDAAHNPRNGALLVIDADHFKRINDKFGHDKGDEALRLIAKTIKATLRNIDLVGRIGGEEFGVFLPGCDPGQTRSVAERIRLAVNDAPFAPDGLPTRLSVSVGGASYESPISLGDLYRAADQRLYAAKRLGRNRVELATLSDADLHAARLALN